ncbi:MAG: PspA/IM30 family protein [Trebonia sp.]
MPHDKIKAAARKRMAETGEPYTAARRAVVTEGQALEGQAATGQIPPPGRGYALAMSGEVHDWLAELRGSDPPAALRVMRALVTLMEKGAGAGGPLVASAADSWPWALMQALDRSYRERLEQLAAVRGDAADAATLVKDIQDQVGALETAQASLEDQHRRALDTDRPQEATEAAGKLAAARQQTAQARLLLPGAVEAGRRLAQASQRLQARAEAWQIRKEVLKASYIAASGSLRARQAIAALGLADDDGDRQDEDSGQAASGASHARPAELTAHMEQALGQQGGPEGLMELRPGAPLRSDILILFAVEPPVTALLIAVLQGLEVVEDQFPEAVTASADMLRRVRAGQAPEAAAHTYADTRSFLEEFYPGDVVGEGSPNELRSSANSLADERSPTQQADLTETRNPNGPI